VSPPSALGNHPDQAKKGKKLPIESLVECADAEKIHDLLIRHFSTDGDQIDVEKLRSTEERWLG